MAHHIIEELEKLKTNKEKVEKWVGMNLTPYYGLSQELTVYMYKLYSDSSGDTSYNGRFNCGNCQMTIWRKLNDFINYGDNVGAPLLNWEAPKKVTKKKDTEINESNEPNNITDTPGLE